MSAILTILASLLGCIAGSLLGAGLFNLFHSASCIELRHVLGTVFSALILDFGVPFIICLFSEHALYITAWFITTCVVTGMYVVPMTVATIHDAVTIEKKDRSTDGSIIATSIALIVIFGISLTVFLVQCKCGTFQAVNDFFDFTFWSLWNGEI